MRTKVCAILTCPPCSGTSALECLSPFASMLMLSSYNLDVDMDADEAATSTTARTNSSIKKQRASKAARIEKKRHRKVKNTMVFSQRHVKAKKGKKR